MDFIESLVDHAAFRPVLVALGVLVLVAAVWRAVAHVRTRRRQRVLKAEYDQFIKEQVARHDTPPESPELVPAAPTGVRMLATPERRRYASEWASVQAGFVEQPAAAVVAADHLIAQVLRDRGYPIHQYGDLGELVAAYHPHEATGFRAAHALTRGNRAQTASVDHLRQSFMHQRLLFHELLDNVAHIDLTTREPRQRPSYHRWFREADSQ